MCFVFLLLVLCTIIIEDFLFRRIHFITFVALLVLSTVVAQYQYSFSYLINQFLFSLLFILLQGVFVWVYFKLLKRDQRAISEMIGLGDVVFYIAIIPLFPFNSFVLFYTFSLVFALMTFLLVKYLFAIKTIPLAGLAALFLLIICVYYYFTSSIPFNFIDLHVQY